MRDSGEFMIDIVIVVGYSSCRRDGASGTTNAIDPGKLKYLKATVMQVELLGDIRAQSLPEWFLRHALGTHVEENRTALRGWRDVLLRYRDEGLELISFGRLRGWDWAHWLSPCVAA